MLQVGTILWAKNRPGDHGDHLHVEPPTRKTGTPPLKNPGMTPGVQAIFDALVVQFGPANYINTSRPGWSHMGWYNRRKIAGSQTWSQHAYANAIDIGPYLGVAQQQRFYDFLTGITTPPPSTGDDDLETIIAALKAQSSAFYQRCQQVTGNPAGNAAWWGRDYVLQPGEGPPTDQEWRDAAPILLAAALELGVLFSTGAPSLNDAQVRAIALEAGAQVFVEKGKPVTIRGS